MNKYIMINGAVGLVIVAGVSYTIGYFAGKNKYQKLLAKILMKYVPKELF